jgi:hypothetical protein
MLFRMATIYQNSGTHRFLLLWKASYTVNGYSQKRINTPRLRFVERFFGVGAFTPQGRAISQRAEQL